MQEGIEENSPPDPLKDLITKRGRIAQTKAKNLFDRFIRISLIDSYYTRNQF
jgi:transposase